MSMGELLKRVFAAALSCAPAVIVQSMVVPLAIAQVSQLSTLRGAVTDASGAVVPGVKIEVLDQSTNSARTVLTDVNGDYDVPGVKGVSYRGAI
jgi:hypothetical protein